MIITVEKVRAEELKPGELFSTAGPAYWVSRDPLALGERVYIRTDAPTPPDQAHDEVYRITVL